MHTVEVSDEIYRQVMIVRKVIDAVLGESLERDSDYIEFVLILGIQKTLLDPLPKEETLQKTIIAMFMQNPCFVSEFIADSLKKGEMLQKEKISEQWRTRYIG